MALDRSDTLKRFFDWRQPGGALSAGGHVMLLVAGLYTMSSAKPFTPAQESVAVDVVSEKDFAEMMKGDKTSKVVAKAPERRVEKVDPAIKDNDPGAEKKDVASAEAPKAPPPVAKTVEPKPEPPKPQAEQKVAVVTPPARPPELRVAPPVPAPPAKAAEEEDDEVDEKAELLRKKKLEDKKKADEAAKAAADEKRKLDEKLKAEAEAQKRAEDKQREADRQAKAAEDRKKLDEKLKAEAEAEKRAEEKAKADEKKKADAEKKAKDDKAKKDQAAREAAEAEKLNNAIRQRLLASKEAPSSSGSTGAALSNRSTAGTTEATGKKLSPSDRSQLIGILTEQMNRCISYSGSAPKTGPQLTFTMTKEGAIAGGVQLANRSGEANFTAFSEAAMRALRNCQPYRIPARFLDSYDDWKNVRLNIDTSDMQ